MLPKSHTLLSILFIALLSLLTFAQNIKMQKPSGDKPQSSLKRSKMDKTEKKLTLQQQRVLGLIRQVSDIAKSLDNEESKVKIRSQIAELLWPFDEPQARTLFEAVFQEANNAFNNALKESKSQPASSLAASHQLQQLNHVLSSIAQYDKNWAEILLKSVANTKISGNYNSQSFLTLQMAMTLAETHPEIAHQIVLSSLNNGINPMIGNILHKLQHSNPALAEEIFINALSIAKGDLANAFINIKILSLYVFPSTTTDSLESVMGRNPESSPLKPVLVQQFLSFAYDTLMQQGNPAPGTDSIDPMYARYKPTFDYQTAYSLLPYFDQYMPDKAGMIRAQLNEMSRNLSNEQMDAIINSNSPGRIQALLDKALLAPLAMKDGLYTQAAMLASRTGNTDQALSIALSISKEKRTDIVSIINYQAAMKAIGKGEFDLAYHYAQGITIAPQSSLIFSQMAQAMMEKKLKSKAIDTLNDAELIIEKFESDSNKAFALLQITEAMIKLDTNRGFEMMQTVVKAFNQAEFSTFDKANPSGKLSIGLSSINFNLSFSKLALVDLERTLYLAQSIELKDASVMAQLAACRGILINKDKTSTEKQEIIDKKTKALKEKASRKIEQ
jgi:hypothetical protein